MRTRSQLSDSTTPRPPGAGSRRLFRSACFLAIALACIAGCARGGDDPWAVDANGDASPGDTNIAALDAPHTDAPPSDAATIDARSDLVANDTPVPPSDAPIAPRDSFVPPPDVADTGNVNDTGSSSLDPALARPDPSGPPCATPGSENGCPPVEVCRIDSANGGRCEGCTACGNLGASCTTSDDCDILFQCYQGTCRNICPLGSTYCGNPASCLDVGNSQYGVCAQ